MRRTAIIAMVASLGYLSACGSPSSPSPTGGRPTTAVTPSASSSVATPSAGPVRPSAACAYLTSAEILQYTGITITGTSDLRGGGCAYMSAAGSHLAPRAVQFLDGHDGVIAGVASGAVSPTPQCVSVVVPGLTGPAAVCAVAGPEVISAFPVAPGKVGEINVFSSTALSSDQSVQLIMAAYPRMRQ
jgi:hypothetical protein